MYGSGVLAAMDGLVRFEKLNEKMLRIEMLYYYSPNLISIMSPCLVQLFANVYDKHEIETI